MSTRIRFIKNTLSLSIADIIRPFITMFFVVYVSRTLGAAGLGVYSAVIAFVFFFEKIGELGLHHLIVRDIAIDRKRAESYLSATTIVGILSSILVTPLLIAILKTFRYDPEIAVNIKILAISLVFVVLTQYWLSFFEGFQRMEFKSILILIEAVMKTVLGILAIRMGYGVIGLIWTHVICRLISGLFCFGVLFKIGVRPVFKLDLSLVFSLLRQTMVFFMTSLVTTTYWKIDVIMLSKLRPVDDVGVYSAAYRFLEILKGLSYSYIAALFPIFASSFWESREAFIHKFRLSIRYLYILTFPTVLGTTILAKKIIMMFYGSEFNASIGILQVLIWTLCFFPIALIFAKTLVSSNHQRYDLYANILGMLFNVSLNFILIRLWGALGAALATSLSIAFFLVIQYIFVHKKVLKIHFMKELIKPTIAGCMMGVITYLLRASNFFLVVGISIVVYVVILFLINTFSSEELRTFKDIWKKRSLFFAFHE